MAMEKSFHLSGGAFAMTALNSIQLASNAEDARLAKTLAEKLGPTWPSATVRLARLKPALTTEAAQQYTVAHSCDTP